MITTRNTNTNNESYDIIHIYDFRPNLLDDNLIPSKELALDISLVPK